MSFKMCRRGGEEKCGGKGWGKKYSTVRRGHKETPEQVNGDYCIEDGRTALLFLPINNRKRLGWGKIVLSTRASVGVPQYKAKIKLYSVTESGLKPISRMGKVCTQAGNQTWWLCTPMLVKICFLFVFHAKSLKKEEK